MTGQWHVAQLNVGRLVNTLDSPELAPFATALDRINALADAAPGFVWRLVGSGNNATDILPTDDPLSLVNLSLWESIEALFDFTYRSAHTDIMARRREFFRRPDAAHQVLWWVPAGHIPSVDEALRRLQHLREFGASLHAFTFRERFEPLAAT
jgi:hypothetical protein